MKYWSKYGNEVYLGHSIEILNTLKRESINTVVTSPPYWGLRDYGTDPLIWDINFECDHEWTVEDICPTKIGKQGSTEIIKNLSLVKSMNKPEKSSFCKKCGAWCGSLGLEPTPELYVKHLADIFDLVKKVLRKDGTVWLNLGSNYYGGGWKGSKTDISKTKQGTNKGTLCGKNMERDLKHLIFKPKDLVPIPWMVGLELQRRGWWLRSDIIWAKNNPMPESVKDRPTRSKEYILLLSKSKKYYYDQESIKEDSIYFEKKERPSGMERNAGKYCEKANYGGGGTSFQGHSGCYKADGTLISNKKRNKRDVWNVNTKPFKEAHFAVFPKELIIPCILAGCPENGIVLDPFFGSGTTGIAAYSNYRKFIGIELNKKYLDNITIPRLENKVRNRL